MGASAVQAQTFQVLYNFSNGPDGASPNGLTIDHAGNLYGTTGGPGNCFTGGCGGVFLFSHSGQIWTLTPLYHFQGGTDGRRPLAGITIGPDGRLYGTTTLGGTGHCMQESVPGCGTVYRLTPPQKLKHCATSYCPWDETILYSFQGGSDIQWPSSEPTFDQAGNLYGTAVQGGRNVLGGGVYQMKQSQGIWSYSLLYSFSGGPDGEMPEGAVVPDQMGNVYGTTFAAGANGYGTAFELTPSENAWSETTLYTFQGKADGGNSAVGLIFDDAGNLYGVTTAGGLNGDGSVFSLTHGGFGFVPLYNGFNSFFGPNLGPLSKLIMDQNGNLYGTQYAGGANEQGLVFKLSPGMDGWTFTDLHDFTGIDGSNPTGNIVLDANGNLYGTTSQGGTKNDGVIWKVTP